MYRARVDVGAATFANKEEIKPWLQQQYAPFQLAVAIERSDNVKIVFRCRAGRSLCPFRVRANYSVRSARWTLLVMCDLHNHKVHRGHEEDADGASRPVDPDAVIQSGDGSRPGRRMRAPAFQRRTGVFVGVAPPADVDAVVQRTGAQVAQLMQRHIWQNRTLLAEQKEAAVARVVAELVDEYLGDGRIAATAPISADAVQLPNVDAVSRGAGPLPPFDLLLRRLPLLPPDNTLNPVQLMKTYDLREFKVDNIGATPFALSDRPDLLANLTYASWTTD